MVKKINKSEFLKKVWNYEISQGQWKFEGSRPAIIDFYATWCGPCRALAPSMEKLSDEYAGKVDFYKVDTDEESELAQVFGIRSIPSLLFCPAHNEPKMSQGALPEDTLRQIINSELLKQ